MFMKHCHTKHPDHMQALRYIQRSLMAMALILSANLLYAQADIKVDINKNEGGGGWYANPIVWIVAAAVFILLLVALLRGGRK
jgi:hypothetical protein